MKNKNENSKHCMRNRKKWEEKPSQSVFLPASFHLSYNIFCFYFLISIFHPPIPITSQNLNLFQKNICTIRDYPLPMFLLIPPIPPPLSFAKIPNRQRCFPFPPYRIRPPPKHFILQNCNPLVKTQMMTF